MPVLYTEMEFEKAEPATIVWGRLDSALTATTDESSRVIRPHNVKTFLGAVGLEITEIVLMGLAINSSCLTKPVDVNLAHNRLLLPEIDNSENFSFIINETVKVEDIRILPESDLIAIDKYLVAGIKSRIEETAGS